MKTYETFKLNKEFRRLYGRGKSLVFPSVVIYFTKNNLKKCRIGITVSKKIGSAVKRNRAKRVILAAFRKAFPLVSGGYDFVFVARVRTPNLKSDVIYDALIKGFKKEGIIAENEKDNDLGN